MNAPHPSPSASALPRAGRSEAGALAAPSPSGVASGAAGGREGAGTGAAIAIACVVVAVLGSLAMLAIGLRTGEAGRTLVALGGAGVIMSLLIGPAAILVALRLGRASPDAAADHLAGLLRGLSRLQENAALSDDARRVLFRRQDRDLLRRAIEEDIHAEDWDAAMVLVKELAERFGYRSDAEEFRQRIEQARFETVQRRVSDAVARLDALIVQRRWDQAIVEAARIGRLYPDSPRVEGLRHRVEQARSLYKTELERRFLTAAQEDRIDEAMDLLKELDQYLTEAEAGPYREVARGVIGKARENLGVQFKLAVQDGRWARASEVGDRIMTEFPNSRMAHEVRSMIDSINAKAATLPRSAAG